jgi:hypothetical protein
MRAGREHAEFQGLERCGELSEVKGRRKRAARAVRAHGDRLSAWFLKRFNGCVATQSYRISRVQAPIEMVKGRFVGK